MFSNPKSIAFYNATQKNPHSYLPQPTLFLTENHVPLETETTSSFCDCTAHLLLCISEIYQVILAN